MSATRSSSTPSPSPVGGAGAMPPVMRMTWRHLLFVHWPAPLASIRPLVPEPLEIDRYDGWAWVGLIPFTMMDVSLRGLPRVAWRGLTDFHECNVRTYVRRGEETGVYFFSLDAASRLAVWVARRFFHLAYQHARMVMAVNGEEIAYAVDRIDPPRASLRCRWRLGRALPSSSSGELAHFLTERYRLFTVDQRDRPYRCRIAHEPWQLREAAVLELDDGLVAAAGAAIRPATPPTVFAADGMRVTAWLPEPC